MLCLCLQQRFALTKTVVECGKKRKLYLLKTDPSTKLEQSLESTVDHIMHMWWLWEVLRYDETQRKKHERM